jgi:DNA-binding transcriptional MerR regulator
MFRIGEFSQIARVPGRLRRYHDSIGLLRPDDIDPQTGYRYYRAQQLPHLNRILALKKDAGDPVSGGKGGVTKARNAIQRLPARAT